MKHDMLQAQGLPQEFARKGDNRNNKGWNWRKTFVMLKQYFPRLSSEKLFDVMLVREATYWELFVCQRDSPQTNKRAHDSLITNSSLVLCSKFEQLFGNHLFTLIGIKKVLNRSHTIGRYY